MHSVLILITISSKMQDLGKVSGWQLYRFWKNLSIDLLVLVGVLTFSKILPHYFSPIISLFAAMLLYTLIYREQQNNKTTCVLLSYTLFLSLIVYSFAAIGLNLLHLWNIIYTPKELVFFSSPYIPSLMLMPICFLITSLMYIRRKSLAICVECRMNRNSSYESGKLSSLLNSESHFQLKNLILLFGILSVLIWIYYLVFYININTNQRDWYVFTWLVVITFLFDEIYFAIRYYNLYLDLKDRNEIITPEELNDMTAKTYLRYYVVCGEKIYLDLNAFDAVDSFRAVIDTPFFTKRSMNGVTNAEVLRTIQQFTGVKDGKLRFFFGRKSSDLRRHSLLRYFYFLDGSLEDYPTLRTQGEWVDFANLKHLYSIAPQQLSSTFVTDLTRLATIILTHKMFDERGNRRYRIKSYTPSFTLEDVEKSNLDFQDDKWIRISLFNSDTPMFKLKRWWRELTGKGKAGSWH